MRLSNVIAAAVAGAPIVVLGAGQLGYAIGSKLPGICLFPLFYCMIVLLRQWPNDLFYQTAHANLLRIMRKTSTF